jgi:tetratricopeptide (TPR) repeat protein
MSMDGYPMTQSIEVLTLSAMQHLAEVGFLASEMGLSDQAVAIFSGLAKIRPEQPHSGINLALVYARYDKAEEAIELLQLLQKKFPDNQMVMSVLGVCLVQQEKPGALALLDQVLSRQTDTDAMNVARSCYDLAKQQQAGREHKTPTEGLQFFRHYNHQV